MAKKIAAMVKLQCPAGAANPAPPVGTALGPHGVNIMEFCKQFNARTQSQSGMVIPVVVTIFSDRTFSFITKTPPAPNLLLKEAGIEKGSASPNRTKVGKVSARIAQEDRRDQDGRPQRFGPRVRDEDDRWNRALHGAGGHRLMPAAGKKYRAAVGQGRRGPGVLARTGGRRWSSRPPIPSSTPPSTWPCVSGVDPRHADQVVRGTVILPHGTGKSHSRAGDRAR